MKHRVAENRCCRCGAGWTDLPAGFARHQGCPACGSVYWTWSNYADEPAGLSVRSVNLAHTADGKSPGCPGDPGPV